MSKQKQKHKHRRENRHSTVPVVLKEYHIDRGMVSTVQWLNSFQGVYTLFSCEGYDSARKSPYVMFHCWDVYDLQKICEQIQRFPGFEFGTIVVENFFGHLRYILRFNSIKTFADFKQRMGFIDPPEPTGEELLEIVNKALGWQEKKALHQIRKEREKNGRSKETSGSDDIDNGLMQQD